MVLNPIIETEQVDTEKNLYCSTILPTNNVFLTTQLMQFISMEEEDVIFGLKENSMKLPDSIQGQICGKKHYRTISYCKYGTGYVCDRCGYGYNTFDIMYVCDESSNNNKPTCQEKDICCKCAIQLMDARKQDMDVDTNRHLQQESVKSNIYNTINIPMIHTRYVHKKKKSYPHMTSRVLVNYNLHEKSKYQSSIVHNKKENKKPNNPNTGAHETNINNEISLHQPLIDTSRTTKPTITTQAPHIDLTETDDEKDTINGNNSPIIVPGVSK